MRLRWGSLCKYETKEEWHKAALRQCVMSKKHSIIVCAYCSKQCVKENESKKYSKNSRNIRHTYAVLLPLFITPELEYVASNANPVDPILHRESGVLGKQIFPSFQLPDELRPCFIYVQSWSFHFFGDTCHQEVCGWKILLSTMPHIHLKIFSLFLFCTIFICIK